MYKGLIIVVLIASQLLSAQTRGDLFSENYASGQMWTQVNSGVEVVNGQVVAKNTSASLFQHRLFQKLDSTIKQKDNWRIETDFAIHKSLNGNILFDIVALSTTNKDIRMQCDSWTDYCCGYNSPTCPQQFELPLKSFFVYAYTPVVYDPENNELNLGFGFGNSTNGFGIKADQAISLKYDQRYYVVFDKVDTLYTLHTYLTPDHSTEVSGSPIVVHCDSTLPDYNYVQHGVNTGGGKGRYSTIEIDNTYITDLNNVREESKDSLAIYNFVTANADGKNDYFLIDGLDALSDYELTIFNVYGNVIFQTKDYKNNWNGKDLEAGTYFYRFRHGDKELFNTIFLSK